MCARCGVSAVRYCVPGAVCVGGRGAHDRAKAKAKQQYYTGLQVRCVCVCVGGHVTVLQVLGIGGGGGGKEVYDGLVRWRAGEGAHVCTLLIPCSFVSVLPPCISTIPPYPLPPPPYTV